MLEEALVLVDEPDRWFSRFAIVAAGCGLGDLDEHPATSLVRPRSLPWRRGRGRCDAELFGRRCHRLRAQPRSPRHVLDGGEAEPPPADRRAVSRRLGVVLDDLCLRRPGMSGSATASDSPERSLWRKRR